MKPDTLLRRRNTANAITVAAWSRCGADSLVPFIRRRWFHHTNERTNELTPLVFSRRCSSRIDSRHRTNTPADYFRREWRRRIEKEPMNKERRMINGRKDQLTISVSTFIMYIKRRRCRRAKETACHVETAFSSINCSMTWLHVVVCGNTNTVNSSHSITTTTTTTNTRRTIITRCRPNGT